MASELPPPYGALANLSSAGWGHAPNPPRLDKYIDDIQVGVDVRFFNRKPEPDVLEQKKILIKSEDREYLEELLKNKDISFVVKNIENNLYEFIFDKNRWSEISAHFPSEENSEENTIENKEPISQNLQRSVDALITKSKKIAAENIRPDLLSEENLSKIDVSKEQLNIFIERKMAAELKEILKKEAISEVEKPQNTPQKKSRSLGRTNQVKCRLTDSELEKFHKRVEKSGVPQGEFVRSAVLTGRIVVKERSVVDVALLDELALLRAELGKQGGMLKMVIKPNEGQRKLNPEEWNKLIDTIRDIEILKKRWAELEANILGDCKTHNI